MTSAVSVKDRLKNLQAEGISMQDALFSYGLERTIYRISISPYAERFTLKGGIFLYALFDGHYARATRDIDLLAQSINNDTDEMKKIFKEIFSIQENTGLTVSGIRIMKSLLIKDTTEDERQKIVADSLGMIDGQCDGCAAGIIDMYDDYIYGKKELKEVNAAFRANYVSADREDNKRSCMME